MDFAKEEDTSSECDFFEDDEDNGDDGDDEAISFIEFRSPDSAYSDCGLKGKASCRK